MRVFFGVLASIFVLLGVGGAWIVQERHRNLALAEANAAARDNARMDRSEQCRIRFEEFDGGADLTYWIDGLVQRGLPVRSQDFESRSDYQVRLEEIMGNAVEPLFVTYGEVDPDNYNAETERLRLEPMSDGSRRHQFGEAPSPSGRPYNSLFEENLPVAWNFSMEIDQAPFFSADDTQRTGFLSLGMARPFRNHRDQVFPGRFDIEIERSRMREIGYDLRVAVYAEPIFPYLILRDDGRSLVTRDPTDLSTAAIFRVQCVAIVHNSEVIAVSSVEGL